MAGTPVTGVMYKKQDKWKMLQVDSGYAKPSDNDWRISDIYHLFPPSSPPPPPPRRGGLGQDGVLDVLNDVRHSRTAGRVSSTRAGSRGRDGRG